MRGWWHELADLVLPAECAGCGRARTTLCGRCRAGLDGTRARRVRPQPTPDGVPAGLPVVYAAVAYADEVRAVLLAHKERGALSLVRPLGAALARAVRAAASASAHEGGGGGGAPGQPGQVLLVPVPSSRRAVAARGHDATRRIALAAAHELRRTGNLARTAPVLRQRRPVADQAALSGRDRLANLGDALTVVGGPSTRRLLAAAPSVVVDDLMTTGASLAAATAAVQAAGGYVAAAAVVAASSGPCGGAEPRD
jgi:predicted amidophosphoribosyltransferase